MRILLVLLFAPSALVFAGEPTTRTSVDPVAARLERLTSFRVEYTLTYHRLGKPATQPAVPSSGGVRITPYRDGRTTTEIFWYSPDSVKWSSDLSSDDVSYLEKNGIRPVPHHEALFHRGTSEILSEASGHDPAGSIQGPSGRMPAGNVVDIGLGLREGERQGDGWLSEQTVGPMERSTDSRGRLVLSSRDAAGQTVERVYDPQLGYAMVSYRRLYQGRPSPVREINASDFRMVAGLPVPFRLEMIGRNKGVPANQYTAVIKSYEFGIEPESHLRFPKNAQVVDTRTDIHYRVKRDNQVLPNEVLAKVANGGESDAVRVLHARAILVAQVHHRFPVGLAAAVGLVVVGGVAAFVYRRRARLRS